MVSDGRRKPFCLNIQLKGHRFTMPRFPKLATWVLLLPVLLFILLSFHENPFNPVTRLKHFFQLRLPGHKRLDGLLTADFPGNSCLSRYQSVLYRKSSPHKPSSYLVAKLRSYEELHKRCGPHTRLYNRAMKQIKSGQIDSSSECNYVIWVAFCGMGNRILSITSAFLYALLTNRVLLINEEPEMEDLFCEPFPHASWILPNDFPFKDQFDSFKQNYAYSYGNMLKKKAITASMESLPSYLHLYLSHDYDHHDKLFFCNQDQTLLRKIPWLIMKSNVYFLPSLFLISSFEEELNKLFPDKETVFHHLGRYLFHPSNLVWGQITGYYKQYLAKADERIGIQLRLFDKKTSSSQFMDQILACTLKEKLLPEVNMSKTIAAPSENQRSKAVLITSLIPDYFEKLNDMYLKHPTLSGETISVYQPSHEEKQHSDNNLHNMKAWSEIYLLSLTDVLVTTAWSTFGYVAQGLGGMRPWILYKISNGQIPDPPCGRALSMEPCYHTPPSYDCKAKTEVDTATLVPHLKHCEDISWGLKLFNYSH